MCPGAHGKPGGCGAPSQVYSQHGSATPEITRALPTEGHWGSSSADPAPGDGAGAAHEALPTLEALTGLPLVAVSYTHLTLPTTILV